MLTDSNSAGFVIRNFIGNIVPHNKIINAYIPDVYGKEKRKAVSSKEGKLGVEGVSADIIREALAKAGVVCRDSGEEKDALSPKTIFILTGSRAATAVKKKDLPF